MCRRAGLLAASLVLCLATVGVASAAASEPLYPTLVGCIGQDSTTGCAATVPQGNYALRDAVKLVVAPNGTDAYGITQNIGDTYDFENALVHFHRAADGSLTFADCVSDQSGGGCATLPAAAGGVLTQPVDLAVSPDGSDVYVAAYLEYAQSSAVSHFHIGPGGVPSYVDCTGSDPGCTAVPEDLLDWPAALAVSPDGGSVYVGAQQWGDVAHLRRDVGGELSFADCLGGIDRTCSRLPNRPCTSGDCNDSSDLQGVHGMALDPSGQNLYTTSEVGVSQLRIGAGGRLSWGSCFDTGTILCHRPPAGVLFSPPWGLAFRPDGHSLYVSTDGNDLQGEVLHLAVHDDGSLTFADCYGVEGDGCATPPSDPAYGSPLAGNDLATVPSVVVGKDGSTLHAFGGFGSVSTFALDSGGALSYQDCVGMGTNCFPHLLPTSAATPSPDGGAYTTARSSFDQIGFQAPAPSFDGANLPHASIGDAINVRSVAADMVGTVWQSPEEFQYSWQWGTSTSYGNSTPWGYGPSTPQGSPLTFDGSLVDLMPDTTYHYRMVVRDTDGIVYTTDNTVTTTSAPSGWTPPLPQVDGAQITAAGPVAATAQMQIQPHGSPTTFWVEYGPTTAYGQETPHGTLPAFGSFLRTLSLPGLAPGSTYHARLVLSSPAGQTTSVDDTFATPAEGPPAQEPPAAFTLAPTQVSDTTATLNGIVGPYGSDTTYRFLYGTDRNSDPTTPTATVDAGGDSAQHDVSTVLTGLAPSTTYYVMLSAVGAGDTVRGGVASFTTAPPGGSGDSGGPGPTGGGSGGPGPTGGGAGSGGGVTGGGGGVTGGGGGGGSTSGATSSGPGAGQPEAGSSVLAPIAGAELHGGGGTAGVAASGPTGSGGPVTSEQQRLTMILSQDAHALLREVNLRTLLARGSEPVALTMPQAGTLSARLFGRRLVHTARGLKPARGPMTLLASGSRALPAGWRFNLALQLTPAGRRLMRRDGTTLQLFAPVAFHPVGK